MKGGTDAPPFFNLVAEKQALTGAADLQCKTVSREFPLRGCSVMFPSYMLMMLGLLWNVKEYDLILRVVGPTR